MTKEISKNLVVQMALYLCYVITLVDMCAAKTMLTQDAPFAPWIKCGATSCAFTMIITSKKSTKNLVGHYSIDPSN